MKIKDNPVCFVIMPFKVRDIDLNKYFNDINHWSEVYNGLIMPAIKEAGLQVQRDDDDYTSRLVGIGIWSKIEKADIVLCDISAHNPNVHLELGWAIRADKKIVFIKDELTEFNFDLNQYYTFQYSHRLQPTNLRESIQNLSKVIVTTLNDNNSNYSIVNKLALQKQATEATFGGNLEVSLLQELLNEVQQVKKGVNFEPVSNNSQISLNIKDPSELPRKLIGTTWRKRNKLEDVFFKDGKEFLYSSVGTQKWIPNEVTFDASNRIMKMLWSHDNFVALCQFDSRYSFFKEQDGTIWDLIALEPYIHSSFK